MFNTLLVGAQILCMLFTQEAYDAYCGLWYNFNKIQLTCKPLDCLCGVSLPELKWSFYDTLIAATQIQKDW